MRYPDGQVACLGDKVRLWKDAEGIVVCSLDTGEYSEEFPESEWSYLEVGVLIHSPQAGLIHYLEAENTFELVSRTKPNRD